MFSENQHTFICPLCGHNEIKFNLHCVDFSLTNEPFDIFKCKHCDFHFTYPVPSKTEIIPYYNFPNYISHTDAKEGWLNKIYHLVRRHTLSQKTNWIQSLFQGQKGTLLDIGAGTGAFASAMEQKGWKVTGLEPDAGSRKKALEINNINLLSTDILFDLPQNSFDVITLWHVLEHVHDLSKYMNAFNALLKPNGRLIIAVPNHTSLDAGFYKKYWAAYDVPRHLYHFSPNSMNLLCKQFHFTINKYKPMWFDSFYVSLLSEKFKKTGFLGVLRAGAIGLISNIATIFNHKKASSIIYEIKKIS
jgi:SAM-dependent methyltransferase